MEYQIKRQQERGKETVLLNKERTSKNMAPLEVRATDVHLDASKARYPKFEGAFTLLIFILSASAAYSSIYFA
jgi:hypothetical protein